ncbi:MAG TPA: hypothetical protein DEB25_04195 [Desulfobulbaceae bacterium]|nr:hypothetical protein [Desulfobulbaceae bacterium]
MKPEEALYFLKSAQALARYHQALGVDHYPAKARLSSLGQMPQPRPTVLTAKTAKPQPQSRPRHESLPVPKAVPITAEMPELSGCRRCVTDDIQPFSAMAGRLGQAPQLLIVGDYLHGDDTSGEFVFGQEEDELLTRMLMAIALTADDALITNLVKCRPAVNDEGKHEPGETVAERCLIHLRRQIILTQPRLILAMGDLPAQILIGQKTSLSALRGRLYNFFPQDGQANSPPQNQPVPVLASYHPAFLLAQNEMKKAAWEDMKMVRRFLASLPLTARAAGR